MNHREKLLSKLAALGKIDESHLPVVTLDEFFVGNDQEDSIAPNQLGFGRPPVREMYDRFKEIEAREDVQGLFVSLHFDWRDFFEDSTWPLAENVHIISSAAQDLVEFWIEGLEADGISPGWPYGRHVAAPEPLPGYQIHTVYWD
jgi:hypothetical protein